MRSPGLFSIAAGMLLFAGAISVSADQWNHLTKITFSEPVEVPNKVLPAGTYIFKLLGSQSDRNIVEIYNANQTHLYDLILTVPDERLRPTGKTLLRFTERAAGSPEALKAWFYPGSEYGQRFVYPHDRAVELAKANNEPVYSTRADLTQYQAKNFKSEKDADAVKMRNSDVRQVEPNGQEQEVAHRGND